MNVLFDILAEIQFIKIHPRRHTTSDADYQAALRTSKFVILSVKVASGGAFDKFLW